MDDDQFVSSLDGEDEKETLGNHQNGSAEEVIKEVSDDKLLL